MDEQMTAIRPYLLWTKVTLVVSTFIRKRVPCP